MLILAIVCLFFAALPALLYFRNISLFRPPPDVDISAVFPEVSVLIPARNEELSIEACVRSVLASQNVFLEVIVLDDHSTDQTSEIVNTIAKEDSRVRLETAPDLPPHWCGKQHACFALSKLARYNYLTFLDADVRLEPNAIARMAAFQRQTQATLVSGFPRQQTGTMLEKLLIPLIHWLLLSFLPFSRMRQSLQQGLGAGCGQWFFTTREAYEKTGGHSAIKESLHDGIKLPRKYRENGLMTDLCDVTDLATCRMYRSASQVWLGLAKNAREGLGNPKLLPFFTTIFLLGQVMPFMVLAWSLVEKNYLAVALSLITIFCLMLPRLHAKNHFRQSLLSAILHPLGIVVFLVLQWYANFKTWIGKPIGWKGRTHPSRSNSLPNSL